MRNSSPCTTTTRPLILVPFLGRRGVRDGWSGADGYLERRRAGCAKLLLVNRMATTSQFKPMVHCILRPDTPCTKDSSCLGARRRIGQEANNITQQGRRPVYDAALATTSH